MVTENTKNILLADNSVFFRTKLSDILNEVGHSVEQAANGNETVEKIAATPDGIDLLIMGLKLEGIDGFGVLRWIKENGHGGRFPVLAVTGEDTPGDFKKRLDEFGVKASMTTEFSPERIVYQVNGLLFPEKAHHRAEPRAPISIRTEYSTAGAPHKDFLLNLSPGGLFLHTNNAVPVGTTVTQSFSLPGSDNLMELSGEVRWSTPGVGPRGLFSGAGVMFTSISPDDRQAIKSFVKAEVAGLSA